MSVSVYGLHAVESVLRNSPERVEVVHVAARDDARVAQQLALAEAAGLQIRSATITELNRMTDEARHQGIVLRCRPAEPLPESALKDKVQAAGDSLLLLVLDGVTDPHNLGACLRTADAAGVDMVIVPKDRAAGLVPAARKVASGAAETVPFVQVTNLARTLRWLRDHGIWIAGTAEEAATSLYEATFPGQLALVMGAEDRGLRRLTREHCDQLLHIPLTGSVGSLNVSVATGICLFEIRRRVA